MKIYGFVTVNTEGFGDGTESDVNIFTDKLECIERAYFEYCEAFDFLENNGWLDESFNDSRVEFEEFMKAFSNLNDYFLIQAYDFHIQLEYFEREI